MIPQVGLAPQGIRSLSPLVPLKEIEYGVYGDLTIIYPKPYSIYLRGSINLKQCDS